VSDGIWNKMDAHSRCYNSIPQMTGYLILIFVSRLGLSRAKSDYLNSSGFKLYVLGIGSGNLNSFTSYELGFNRS